MHSVTRLPSFWRISLHPNNGFTGAQVPDLARHSLSQSPCFRHCLPASRVGLIQVFALDFPAFRHVPPCFSHLTWLSDFSAVGIKTSGSVGATGEIAASLLVSTGIGLGFGRMPAAATCAALSSIPDPLFGPVCSTCLRSRPSSEGNILQPIRIGISKTKIKFARRMICFRKPRKEIVLASGPIVASGARPVRKAPGRLDVRRRCRTKPLATKQGQLLRYWR